MNSRQRNGIKILITVALALIFGINAALNGVGWPAQTWACVAGWAALGVLTLLSPLWLKRR
jgi:hypothetical protein